MCKIKCIWEMHVADEVLVEKTDKVCEKNNIIWKKKVK